MNRKILDIFYNLPALLMVSRKACILKGSVHYSQMVLDSSSSFITYQLEDLTQLNTHQLLLALDRWKFIFFYNMLYSQ